MPRKVSCLFPTFSIFMIAIAVLPVTGQTKAAATAITPTVSRIVSPIDEASRVTIKGSVHPLAKPQFDAGPVDGATAFDRMVLVLGSSPEQEHAARTLLDSQQTQGSPDYHRWLTPEEFGQKFGPSTQDIAQVTGWLKQHGFSVGTIAKSGRWIEFSGTSAQVESAFQTQMRHYLVNGEQHIANSSAISIPAALSPVVKGVLSLHNFYSKPMLTRYPGKLTATTSKGGPGITFSDGTHGLVPGDFAKIYDLNQLYTANLNGSGQTIAIVAISNIDPNDVANFRSLFGLPANPPTIILNGPDPGIDFVFGLGDEATLDTEWSGAVAPHATIDVVVTGGTLTTDPVALGSSFIVDQNLASVMNLSFGQCEAQLAQFGENSFWASLWLQAAAQGISAFVSSGDTGAAGCDPNAPSSTPATGGVAISGLASTPFNTAVGGTEFNETVNGGLASTFWAPTNDPTTLSSAIGYIPEEVWNESCSPTQTGSICQQIGQFLLFSGGGGVSTLYATPPWQMGVTGLSVLNNFVLPGTSTHPRGIPDVSLTAAAIHDPYVYCFSTPTTPDCQSSGGSVTFNNLAGGTSFSSPSFAGIMAIVDQKVGGRQGLANYVLYQLAANETFSSCNSSSRTVPGTPTSCVFNDTTVNNNGVPGNDITNDPTTGALGYPTATGYDLASGLGSVDANNLVNAWATAAGKFQATVTSITTSMGATVNITHGQSVTLTAQVQKNPTGAGPTGTVAFVTDEAAPGGGTFAVGAGQLSGTPASFSAPFNNLPGGTYNLSAHYPGDGTFAASDSAGIPVTVAKENSTITEKSLILSLVTGNVTAGNTVAYGDTSNILAIDGDTVGASGLLPSHGSVTFSFNSAPMTAIAIDNSGIGEFVDCFVPSTTCLAPGTYTVTSTYSGDGISYNASGVSNSLSITVTKGNPTPAVVAPATVGAGAPFTLQAQIGTGFGTIVPTGTVQFFDGATALGSLVTLSGGTASMQATLNSGGNHSLTVQYSGDSTYNAATSSPTTVNVAAPFSFTAASTSQTIAAGGTATYNLNLVPVSGFTGAVSFTCVGAPGGSSCTVSPNPANVTSSASIPLTVSVTNTANARLMTPVLWKQLPFALAGVLGVMLLGIRRNPRQRILMLMAVFLLAGVTSCGGGGSTPKPPTIATLAVNGTANGVSASISLSLTITH